MFMLDARMIFADPRLIMRERIEPSLKKTVRGFFSLLPIVLGMLLVTSLAMTLFAGHITGALFGHGFLVDTVIGALIGSVALGHPSASYILGGELLAAGVELGAVTAFLVTWVTVGITHLPAESLLLGRRFAVLRNVIAFVAALAIAGLVPLTLRFLS
jgi:hypothetical protein